MDLLDRLLGHDAWTTRQLLLRCRGLTDAALDREFDIGHRTVRATLAHIVRNVEVWSDLMSGQPVRADPGAGPQGHPVVARRRLHRPFATKTRKNERTKPIGRTRIRCPIEAIAGQIPHPFRVFVLSCFRDGIFNNSRPPER